MAQFNSLLVTGNSRFINPINGNARNGIYYVKGTQTAATGSWTGVIPVPALYDGLTISYYLPYGGSGNATLNLTLSDGTTTGAINCYYQGNSRLTTHYGTGSNIMLTYHPAGAVSVNGTATTDNRWVAGQNYADGNDTGYQVRDYYNRFVAGSNKVFPYTIIMQNADGRWESIVTSSSTETSKARNTHGFRLGQIALMYGSATYNENAILDNAVVYESYTSGLVDHRYSFNTADNSTSGTTANKPIYLVGSVNSSDGLFYLDTTWWTQTLPTTADGKVYIYLGDAYDYYRMSFRIHHPVYCYIQGAIRQYSQYADITGSSSGSGNKIFTVQPTPPYSVGDLWIADDNNILVCIVARASGSFDSDDWGSAVDAINNETLETQIAAEIAVVTGNSSSGGNVILRLNNGIPYETLITDTPTNITSNSAKIYRWDSTGLRYSSTGYNGTYTTIINSSGQIPTGVLIGNINAAVTAIQNFTAAMINGGKLERGAANNSKGTIELQDANGTVIAEVGNYGFKFYGPGSVGSRPYYVIDNSSNGIAGYSSAGTMVFKIATDEFRMPKAYVGTELNIGNKIKIIPMTSGSNDGIAFVAAT